MIMGSKRYLVIGGGLGLWRAELPEVGGAVPPVRAQPLERLAS